MQRPKRSISETTALERGMEKANHINTLMTLSTDSAITSSSLCRADVEMCRLLISVLLLGSIQQNIYFVVRFCLYGLAEWSVSVLSSCHKSDFHISFMCVEALSYIPKQSRRPLERPPSTFQWKGFFLVRVSTSSNATTSGRRGSHSRWYGQRDFSGIHGNVLQFLWELAFQKQPFQLHTMYKEINVTQIENI